MLSAISHFRVVSGTFLIHREKFRKKFLHNGGLRTSAGFDHPEILFLLSAESWPVSRLGGTIRPPGIVVLNARGFVSTSYPKYCTI